jgi:Mrp family chromosome partitioning ATPase
MPSHSSNDAPSTLAKVQGFVSRAGFFWRGGAISLAVVLGASLIVAFAVGDVYESESVVEFAESAVPQERPNEARPETPEEQLRRALTDPAAIEQLTRELAGEPLEGLALQKAIETTGRSIRVGPRGERRFAIAFRAPSAGAAQRGSDWLAQAAMNAIEVRGEPQSEEAQKRVKALEDRTKELAAFVAEHPEVALIPPPSATSGGAPGSSPPPADSALIVLQQQRGRLEWRIAEAEKREASGAANPYDNATDRASLQRMLAQVKAAIAARQAVALRAGAEASAAGRVPSPPPKSAASAALQLEWQRLVERVVEAQLQAPAKREGIAQGGLLRIVQRASLPTRPLKPDKRLIALLGMAGGVWAGIIWAFARVALGHDAGEAWGDESESEGEGEEVSEEGREAETMADRPGWTSVDALDETALPEGTPASASPVTARDGGGWQLLGGGGAAGPPAARGKAGRFPKQLLETAPGVVDVSRVLAQTGALPNRIPPVQVVPIVGVGPHGEPLQAPANPPAEPTPGTYAFHRQEPPPPPPDGPSIPAVPPTMPLVTPAPAHPGPFRRTGVTQTFASPTPPPFRSPAWQPSPAAVPTPAPAPAAPQAPAPTPNYGLALRSKPPEDVLSLRDVPLGWSPHPSMMQTGSMNELLTLRDQLYRLAVNSCFVVGVTSGPDATTAKSTIAAQLASMVAGPGRARVLLIEANFDRPAVQRLMRIDMPFSQGFSEQMRRRMTPVSKKPWVLFRCAANLHVLAEGLVRSPGLLSSVQFGEAIAELRGYYDVIVADGPIAESTIDTVAFDALMDGIVLVGAVGSSPSKLLDDASRWFAHKQLMAVISADASAEERIEFGPQNK